MVNNRKEIIEDAINALFLSIQNSIDQKDGGVAGMFMSDEKNCQIIESFINDYLDLEELIEGD